MSDKKNPTNSHSPVNYRAATLADTEGIRALYEEWGYTRTIGAEDPIWVALIENALVGVCRVAPEFGTFVFRGLYVVARYRGDGIGSGLARTALAAAAVPECYCLPEPHLVRFYTDLGFKEIEVGSVPPFLAERMRLYRLEGYDVAPMRRDG